MTQRFTILAALWLMPFLGVQALGQENDLPALSPTITIRDQDEKVNLELKEVEKFLTAGEFGAAIDILQGLLNDISRLVGSGKVHDSVHPYGDGPPYRIALGSRAYIRRLLSTLPPEAIEIYQKRHEKLAAVAFREAFPHDPKRLLDIAQTYPITRAAYRARLVLADFALEAGDALLAETHLRDILIDCDGALDSSQKANITARLLIAKSARSAPREVEGTIRETVDHLGDETLLIAGKKVSYRDFTENLSGMTESGPAKDSTTPSNSSWSTFCGSNSRTEQAPDLEGPLRAATSHKSPYPQTPERFFRRTAPLSELLTWKSPLVATYPVIDADEGVVYSHTENAITALRIADGSTLWQKSLDEISAEMNGGQENESPPEKIPGTTPGRRGVRPFSLADLRDLSGRRKEHRPRYLTLSGRFLLATVEMLTPSPTSSGRPVKVLLALDRYNGGKVIWSAGAERTDDPLLKGVEFTAVPVVRGNRVFVGARRIAEQSNERKALVLSLDLMTGKLIFRTFLCSGPNLYPSDQLDPETPTLSEAGGVLYCSTGLGVLAALSCETGEVRWIFRYSRFPSRGKQGATTLSYRNPWRDDPLFVVGDRLYSTPPDSNRLHILFLSPEKGTGAIRNDQVEKESLDYVIGVDDGWIYLAGRSRDGKQQMVTAVSPDAKASALQWEFIIPNPPPERSEAKDRLHGRGLLGEHVVYVPTTKAIYTLEKKTGKVAGIISRVVRGSRELLPAGNIIPAPGTLISASPNQLDFLKQVP